MDAVGGQHPAKSQPDEVNILASGAQTIVEGFIKALSRLQDLQVSFQFDGVGSNTSVFIEAFEPPGSKALQRELHNWPRPFSSPSS